MLRFLPDWLFWQNYIPVILEICKPISGHPTTHSIERDGQLKIGIALYPLCQAQFTSKKRPVPDRPAEHN